MKTAITKAFLLITSCDPELVNILGTTAKMSIASSIIALMIGTPLGIFLGGCRFPGRKAFVIINRTLMGTPPVVCGLIFYMLFSGVGPFRGMHALFTVNIMIAAQVILITPIIAGTLESQVVMIAPAIRETSSGLGISRMRTMLLIANESMYQIISSYLLGFCRAIAEVGAISMVGGAIAWKTNVMTTAIMLYTNRGDFSLGIALGMILMGISLTVNLIVTLAQNRKK